ncbi:MAG: bifunctional folylpolyglutamate synthase/dihydrofolate synthase [unclassified Hahellaceae]|nr:bifunctional folylpolyglutamate synthase/dihydrofolate synthase [Hahellaceae bacterium]|tara:strand:+ start:72436 stop:73827 length:1392 start_codon:yes stop_codon:yes gene_type:complete
MTQEIAESPVPGSRDLPAWLAYLENMLGPEFSMRPGLERSALVWQQLNPDDQRLARQIVIVAGTNGKGSTAAAIAELGRASGLRVGVYGSPHVLRFNERCRIDGVEVSDAAFCAAFERVEAARRQCGGPAVAPLSYYEFTTLAVFALLRDAAVDLVVLEVGLGGRLDTVNLIDADLAVITRIGLDHQAVLGDTLDAIGAEKAGVLRSEALCVLGSRDMPNSVLTRVQDLRNEVRIYGEHFDEHRYGLTDVSPGHSGTRLPAANLAAACATFELLGHQLPRNHVQLLDSLTLPGRLQILQSDPIICIDAAHNAQAAVYLAEWLERQTGRQAGSSQATQGEKTGEIRAIFSCFADKSIEALILPMLHLVSRWYLFPLQGARAAALPRLRQAADTAIATARKDRGAGEASAFVPSIEAHESLVTALEAATDGLRPGDCLVAFGSFQVVEAMLLQWQRRSDNNLNAS